MLANKIIADRAITFRIDSRSKEQAERMLNEMGINMTTYLSSSIKALIRERKIPFDLVTEEYLRDRAILAELDEIDEEMSMPDAKWLTRDEVFSPIRERFGYEV